RDFRVLFSDGPIRAHGGHDERTGDDGSDLVMQVLRDGPGAEDEIGETCQAEGTVGVERVTGGILHEGVGGDDEISGEPASDEESGGGDEVEFGTQAAFVP